MKRVWRIAAALLLVGMIGAGCSQGHAAESPYIQAHASSSP